ncbi:hypothetical protein HDZ31DRAFT_76940, partial [Schizophyllum fasciatum]
IPLSLPSIHLLLPVDGPGCGPSWLLYRVRTFYLGYLSDKLRSGLDKMRWLLPLNPSKHYKPFTMVQAGTGWPDIYSMAVQAHLLVAYTWNAHMYTPLLEKDDDSLSAVAYAVAAVEKEVTRLSGLADDEERNYHGSARQLAACSNVLNRMAALENELDRQREEMRKQEAITSARFETLERTVNENFKHANTKIAGLEERITRIVPVSAQWKAKVETACTQVGVLVPAFNERLASETTEGYLSRLMRNLIHTMACSSDLSDRFKSFLVDIGCVPAKTSDVSESTLHCPDTLEDPCLKLSDIPGAVEDALINSDAVRQRLVRLILPEWHAMDDHTDDVFQQTRPPSADRSIDVFAEQFIASNSSNAEFAAFPSFFPDPSRELGRQREVGQASHSLAMIPRTPSRTNIELSPVLSAPKPSSSPLTSVATGGNGNGASIGTSGLVPHERARLADISSAVDAHPVSPDGAGARRLGGLMFSPILAPEVSKSWPSSPPPTGSRDETPELASPTLIFERPRASTALPAGHDRDLTPWLESQECGPFVTACPLRGINANLPYGLFVIRDTSCGNGLRGPNSTLPMGTYGCSYVGICPEAVTFLVDSHMLHIAGIVSFMGSDLFVAPAYICVYA